MKYILLSGGVISGLGKGNLAVAIASILKNSNVKTTIIKIDPYLNTHAGSFSPSEHGEVYVLADGSEVDLDFGTYQRMLNQSFSNCHTITNGTVYSHVMKKEYDSEYDGKTIQIVPSITNEIIRQIEEGAHAGIEKLNGSRNRGEPMEFKPPEVCIIELGGTIGDIESITFLEAFKKLKRDNDFMSIHLSLIISHNGNLKSKPAQNSLSELSKRNFPADLTFLRCQERGFKGEMTGYEEIELNEIFRKISNASSLKKDQIIHFPTVDSVYSLPGILNEAVFKHIAEKLNLKQGFRGVENGHGLLIEKLNNFSKFQIENVKGGRKSSGCIAIIGKYKSTHDAYISLKEAIEHAAYDLKKRFEVEFIHIEDDDSLNNYNLDKYDGIILPGGFGVRGSDALMKASRFARINKIPFLGICFGFQLSLLEIGNSEQGQDIYTSMEFIKDDFNGIDNGKEVLFIQVDPTDAPNPNRNMRLGRLNVNLTDGIARNLYKKKCISEIHRHRYQFNMEYDSKIPVKFTGFSDQVPEIFELDMLDHPFFVGVQYHPEYTSTSFHPSPIIRGFLNAIKNE